MSEEASPDNLLFATYERYIGEPEDETDVYAGFGLFFAGVVSAVLGLLLFLVGASVYGIRTDSYFALAQPAYVLGMLSLPVLLLGIVVLLPTERRVVWSAAAGVAVTVVAAGAFLAAYPDQWFEFNLQHTLLVVGTYAAGLAAVTAATGAALVAHHLSRAEPPAPSDIEADADAAATATSEATAETVTDDQVQADIEEAMSDVELNWGGVETDESTRLTFTSDYADENTGDLDVEATRTVSDRGVDSQVEGLMALKGGAQETATSTTTVDDEASALSELKEQKRRDEVPADAPVTDEGTLTRLVERLGLR